MSKFTEALKRFFVKLFSPETAKYLMIAEEVAAIVVLATPNKTDDEVLALLTQYNMPELAQYPVDKALAALALTLMKKKLPGVDVASLAPLITAAIVALRNKKQ